MRFKPMPPKCQFGATTNCTTKLYIDKLYAQQPTGFISRTVCLPLSVSISQTLFIFLRKLISPFKIFYEIPRPPVRFHKRLPLNHFVG